MTDHSHSHDTHAAADHGHGGHGHDDHGGIAKYIKIFVALCVLTGASFFTYSDAWPWHDKPAVGWAFMMAVSCTKALLVMLFFMHLIWEADWKYVLTIPASFMSLFLVVALIPDVGMRVHGSYGYSHSPSRMQYVGQPSDTEALVNASLPYAEDKEHGGAKH